MAGTSLQSLYPRKTSLPIVQEVGRARGRGLDDTENFTSSLGFDFRTVHLLAILATDKRNIPFQNSICPLRTQSEYSYCGVNCCARTVVCGVCISFTEDYVAFTFRVKCRRRKYFLRNTGILGHMLYSPLHIKTLRKSKCFITN